MMKSKIQFKRGSEAAWNDENNAGHSLNYGQLGVVFSEDNRTHIAVGGIWTHNEDNYYEVLGNQSYVSNKDVNDTFPSVDSFVEGDRSRIGNHNAIYRGKDLTNVYTLDRICTLISNRWLDDLYVGDYFDITMSTPYTSSETVRCVIAGFDYYYGRGKNDNKMDKPHAVIVPERPFAKNHMFVSSIPDGPWDYYHSYINQSVLPKYLTAIESVFGADHVLSFSDILPDALDVDGVSDVNNVLLSSSGPSSTVSYSGRVSGSNWYNIKMRLMNEVQVTGYRKFSTSYMDIGYADSQLPIFTHRPDLICAPDKPYWLSTWFGKYRTSTRFSIYQNEVQSSGSIAGVVAALTAGVRPIWLIG